MNEFNKEKKPMNEWLEFVLNIAEMTLLSIGFLAVALTVLGD